MGNRECRTYVINHSLPWLQRRGACLSLARRTVMGAVATPAEPATSRFWQFRSRSIRTQLALLVLVFTVPVFMTVVLYLANERERKRDMALDQIRMLADNTADRLQASLDDYHITLDLIANRPAVKSLDHGVCDPLIGDFIRLDPLTLTIGTRDLDGKPICTFRAQPPTREKFVEFPWYRQAVDHEDFYASDVFFAPLAGRWSTVLTTPIRDGRGVQAGLVVLPLDLMAWNEQIVRRIPPGALVGVLDRQHRILLFSQQAQNWIAKPVSEHLPAFQAADFTGASGIVTIADGLDVRRIFAWQHVPQTGWIVLAGLPESDVFAAADEAMRTSVSISIALLVLALVLAWRIGRSITRPLESMAATTTRFATGDFQARVAPQPGPPEVSALGNAFNHMLQALEQSQQALRDNEENLAITLQSIGDAVMATDTQGRITRMNPAAEKLTGWTQAQALGHPLVDVFRISNAQDHAIPNPVQRVLETGEVVELANDTELLARDGARYQISDTAAPIRDRAGVVVGVVLVFSDVTAQYTARRALGEAHTFLRQIIDNLPLGLSVMDSQGRYLEWNPAMESIRGRSRQDMLGRTIADTCPREPPAMYDEVMDAVARALQGEFVVRPDVPLIGRDPALWNTVIHAPVRDAQDTIVGTLSIVQDVTARKTAELSLRASEENLAVTLQSIGDAVIATDVLGRITRMNPVAERMTGWDMDQAHGRPLTEVFRIVHAHTREVPEDPVARVLATGEVVGLANHTALLSRDGTERQISDSAAPIRDAQGRLLGVVLVFSDVTQAYHLQQVLVESEGRYRAVVDASPIGIVVHQHERMVFVNPAAVKAIGAPNAQVLLGRALKDFIHPDHLDEIAKRAKLVKGGQTELPMAEWRYLRLDGSVIDVQAQATAIRLNGELAVQLSFMDITERKRDQAVLRENEARFRALTSLSSDWYWEQDTEFRYLRVITGETDWFRAVEQVDPGATYVGKTRWEVGEISRTPAQWDEHRAVLHAHQEFRDLQLCYRNLDGSMRWASVSGMPVFDQRGEFRGYCGIGRDITTQKLAEEQINSLAFYDALTELPNRRLLIEQLKQALLTHARNHQRGALLFIDLDNFKSLNDTSGHETGDLLLKQVGQRLQGCVREADTVARLGGDEFVVMLPGLSADPTVAAADAELVGHKILLAFAPPFLLAGREYRSTPSLGITLFGDGTQGVEDLLKQADLAMYQAKAAGRNTLRLFDQGMQAAVDARVALESDLHAALEARQFVLHYQPVVGNGGLVTGAEALVRWVHPTRGMVSPGQFIPLAEATRLIVPLGAWVLDTACAQLARWSGRPDTRRLAMSVNVSAHQLMEPDFVAQVLAALDRNGADPTRLKLELTESLMADNIETVICKMTALRGRGVDFSLDDFGTGYSSLSYLKRLPLSHLKIDQSFVRDLLVDPNDAAIARTIVALGASLGLAVVAEGVETEGQFQFLLETGCDTFQGYWFAHPVPIDVFERLLPGPLPARTGPGMPG